MTTSPTGSIKDIHNIYPGDLYPFLRKPLFLIIDSNNSIAFQNMPNLFGQPFISLLSPIKLPAVFHGNKKSLSAQPFQGGTHIFCVCKAYVKGNVFINVWSAPSCWGR